MAFLLKLCRLPFAAVLLCLASTELCACKYSVRDVGFVELVTGEYRLLLVCDESLPKDRLQHYRDTLTAALVGTQISSDVSYFEQLTTEDQQVLSDAGLRGGPSVVLTSADGGCLPLSEPPQDDAAAAMSEEWLWEIAQVALESPLRRRLLEQLLSCHSVVLVVAGDDADANATALRFAHEASRRVGEQLDRLPKRIDSAPLVVSLERAAAAAERVFLWSAGISSDTADSAQIVILYGRLRRMGPVLAVPGATLGEIESQLALIGQDCECDLDRDWLQGPVVLHRWTDEWAARAVDALGFDPGSPLVKAEVSRILARGSRRFGGSAAALADPDPLLGYREIAVGGESLQPRADQSLPAANPAIDRHAKSEQLVRATAPPIAEEVEVGLASETAAQAPWTPARWILTSFLALAVAAGSGILVHSWWRN